MPFKDWGGMCPPDGSQGAYTGLIISRGDEDEGNDLERLCLEELRAKESDAAYGKYKSLQRRGLIREESYDRNRRLSTYELTETGQARLRELQSSNHEK